jgi:hypothetical protein
MDKEQLQHYYEETFSMMASKGWKYFVEDMENLRETVDSVSSTLNAEDLFFKKGQLDILTLILTRKKICEESYNKLNGEDE